LITDGFAFVAVLTALGGLVAFLERRKQLKVFKWIPGIVFLYLGAALLNTVGIFGESESIEAADSSVNDALLPAMILLLLFNCDIRQIIKLGPRLIITFFVATFSIILGFTIVYLLFQGFYASETWRAFAALAGSWTGGSANMVAVQGILQAPENIFGYALIMDTVNYSVWLVVVFAAVPWAKVFNRFTRADDSYLAEYARRVEGEPESVANKPMDMTGLIGLLGFSLLASAGARWIGGMLPTYGEAVDQTTWTILIVSILGLIVAVTPFGKTGGSMDLGNVMLYVIVGLIASGADFSQITQAPIYVATGFLILLIHLLVMVAYAKIAKADLFTIGVASVANIGGIASAPIIAGAFNRNLVPVGVLFALIGSFCGTYAGLLTGQILSNL